MAVYIVGMIVGATCTIASLVYLLGINLLVAKLVLNRIDPASISDHFQMPLVMCVGTVGVVVYWQTRGLPDTVSATGGFE